MALTEEMRIYHREWKRRYRAEHPTFAAEYRASHLEKMRETQRNSKKKHAEEYKVKRARFTRARPRRVWVWNTLSSHKQHGHTIIIPLKELYEYVESVDHCVYCGRELDWSPFGGVVTINTPTFDRVNNGHILDHIWGGPEDQSDGAITIACLSCNSSKYDKSYLEWTK